MNSKRWRKNSVQSTGSMAAVIAVALLATGNAGAQVPVDDNGNVLTDDYSPLDNGVQVENPNFEGGVLLSASELETLLGPVALYPDDLLAIVLPASTYPLEIVQAARFLEAAEQNPALKPDEEWDDSVVALLNYPDVLKMMNADIDWTWKLGEAVVDQQTDVIAAIESFRDRAYAAGNLKSDEYQTVSVDEGIIEIEPVSEDVIYVPYYEPERVVRYAPQPVYHYYPRAYPVYYYPYASDHYFGRYPFWGVTTAFTIGWTSDRLHVYHPSYNGHPYFGHSYYGSYWRRPSINVYNNYYVNRQGYRPQNRYRVGDYWRPRHRSGPRPKYRSNRDSYRAGSGGYRAPNANRTPGARNNGRSANTGGNAVTRSGNRRQNPDAIRFRPRGDGAYSATRERRLQRAAGRRSNSQGQGRPTVATDARAPLDTRRGKKQRGIRTSIAGGVERAVSARGNTAVSGNDRARANKRLASGGSKRQDAATRRSTDRTANRLANRSTNRLANRSTSDSRQKRVRSGDARANRAARNAAATTTRRAAAGNAKPQRERAARQTNRRSATRSSSAARNVKPQSARSGSAKPRTAKPARNTGKKSQARRSNGGKRAGRQKRN